MNFNKLTNWLSTHVPVKYRLRIVCFWYLLFIMVSTRKHSLQEAAKFSGINASQFSRFLKNHSELAILSLHDLSKKQAKQISKEPLAETSICISNNSCIRLLCPYLELYWPLFLNST
jgi:hypothetical protein